MHQKSIFYASITILLWSFLGYLASQISHIPPFLQVGITLTLAGITFLPWLKDWRVPWKTFVVGVGGIFGNLFFFYTAFHLAPAIEANLINYLWPLLIVLLTPLFLPGIRLRLHHFLGAILGTGGAWLIVSGGSLNPQLDYLPGYLSAAFGALIWACYSLTLKKLPPFSSRATGGFCLVSGLLALALFAAQNPIPSEWPLISGRDWFFLILIGLGPCGVAYSTWDAAMKHGDPRLIGALTYLSPLSSTLVLALVGQFSLAPATLIATLLIVLGAIAGSLDSLNIFRKNQ